MTVPVPGRLRRRAGEHVGDVDISERIAAHGIVDAEQSTMVRHARMSRGILARLRDAGARDGRDEPNGVDEPAMANQGSRHVPLLSPEDGTTSADRIGRGADENFARFEAIG